MADGLVFAGVTCEEALSLTTLDPEEFISHSGQLLNHPGFVKPWQGFPWDKWHIYPSPTWIVDFLMVHILNMAYFVLWHEYCTCFSFLMGSIGNNSKYTVHSMDAIGNFSSYPWWWLQKCWCFFRHRLISRAVSYQDIPGVLPDLFFVFFIFAEFESFPHFHPIYFKCSIVQIG